MVYLRRFPVAALCGVLLLSLLGPHSTSLSAADPIRVVLLVDSSTNMATMLNEFRSGLAAFVDALPDDVEVTMVSTGGQLRLRVPATSDKRRLQEAAARFSSDGGANALLDTLLESDRRFLKPARDRRPIFVVVSTDQPTQNDPPLYAYNDFVRDFVRRRGRAHAVVIRGTQTGLSSVILEHLTSNTDGLYTVMAVANSLSVRMKSIAAEIAAQQ